MGERWGLNIFPPSKVGNDKIHIKKVIKRKFSWPELARRWNTIRHNRWNSNVDVKSVAM